MRPMGKLIAILLIALSGLTGQAGVMRWQIGASGSVVPGVSLAMARVRFSGGIVETRLDVWDGDGWSMSELDPKRRIALFDPTGFAPDSPERMFVQELVDDSMEVRRRPVEDDFSMKNAMQEGEYVALSSFNGVVPTSFLSWNVGYVEEVPEPSCGFLFLAGGSLLALRRRRQ